MKVFWPVEITPELAAQPQRNAPANMLNSFDTMPYPARNGCLRPVAESRADYINGDDGDRFGDYAFNRRAYANNINGLIDNAGGEGGIRTPNRLAPVPHFSVRFMPFSNSVTPCDESANSTPNGVRAIAVTPRNRSC
jgi:hypothetical protein